MVFERLAFNLTSLILFRARAKTKSTDTRQFRNVPCIHETAATFETSPGLIMYSHNFRRKIVNNDHFYSLLYHIWSCSCLYMDCKLLDAIT